MAEYISVIKPPLKDLSFIPKVSEVRALSEELLALGETETIYGGIMGLSAHYRHFGVINPKKHKFPITLTTIKEDTDPYHASQLEKTMEWLIARKVPASTGMSLMELLNLPTYELRMLKSAIMSSEVIEKRARDQAARRAASAPTHEMLKGFDLN